LVAMVDVVLGENGLLMEIIFSKDRAAGPFALWTKRV
jgi:hypothetical protein